MEWPPPLQCFPIGYLMQFLFGTESHFSRWHATNLRMTWHLWRPEWTRTTWLPLGESEWTMNVHSHFLNALLFWEELYPSWPNRKEVGIWNPHSHQGYLMAFGVIGVASRKLKFENSRACLYKYSVHAEAPCAYSRLSNGILCEIAHGTVVYTCIPFHTHVILHQRSNHYKNVNACNCSLRCGSLRFDKLWYAVIPRMPWWHSIAVVAQVSKQHCAGNEPAGWPWFNQNLFLLPPQGSCWTPAMLWELSSLREFIVPWSSRVSKGKETCLRAGILAKLWMRQRLMTMKSNLSNIRDVRHGHHGKTRYTDRTGRTGWSERARSVAMVPLCTRRLSCWQSAHRHCRWYSPSFKAKNFQKSSGQSTGLWRRRCTRRLQLSALKRRKRRKWRSRHHQSHILKAPSHRPPWCGDGTWQDNSRPELSKPRLNM